MNNRFLPATHGGRLGKPAQDRLAETWTARLPNEWADAVEPPLYFANYSEYEIAAQRAVGYDANDRPCFTAHRFVLTETASDDDEEFYEVVAHSEEMAAWRLRDGRWLVFREIRGDRCGAPRGFYSIGPDMPR